ncbi:MAG: hypothetical protein ACTSSH_08855, partial [Candidatus Heimdallarchaeota archaeon]
YVPKTFSKVPGKPIFAEDILLHNRFALDAKSIEINPDYNLVSVKDYLVVYCNSLVPHSPNQIKFIFNVISKIGNQLVLKLFTKLRRGYSLPHIISLVEEGKLSSKMTKCGVDGFKIGQIDYADLELIINYDPIVRTYQSSSWKD